MELPFLNSYIYNIHLIYYKYIYFYVIDLIDNDKFYSFYLLNNVLLDFHHYLNLDDLGDFDDLDDLYEIHY